VASGNRSLTSGHRHTLNDAIANAGLVSCTVFSQILAHSFHRRSFGMGFMVGSASKWAMLLEPLAPPFEVVNVGRLRRLICLDSEIEMIMTTSAQMLFTES
jgi:hypothetical protein